ncbi:MAG: 30S ribosomal protein S6 [Kiloniellaceae bacterium]
MAFYECVLIARQDVATSQVENLVAEFTKILEDNGGRMAGSEYWGLRTLAYRIKKNRKGHYVMLRVDSPAAAMQELERLLRLNDDVIRYLTVRTETLEEGPSIVMQARNSRDERGDRGDRGGRGDRGDRGDRRGGRDFGRDGGRDGGRPRPPRDADSETTTASEGAAE